MSSGDTSHATEAHDVALTRYQNAMTQEQTLYEEGLAALQNEHAMRVHRISDEYTSALAEADREAGV